MISLCVRDTREVNIITPRFPGEFIYMTLEIEDNEDQNLIKVFPRFVFIFEIRADNEVVGVHRKCKSQWRDRTCALQRYVAAT